VAGPLFIRPAILTTVRIAFHLDAPRWPPLHDPHIFSAFCVASPTRQPLLHIVFLFLTSQFDRRIGDIPNNVFEIHIILIHSRSLPQPHRLFNPSFAADMKVSRGLGFSIAPLIFLLSPTTAQLPYNPTRILQNDTLLYIFRPSTTSNSQFELDTLDLSSTLQPLTLPLTTLYPSLPFLKTDTAQAFTPVINNGGNITVYTGDCAPGAAGAEIWTFTSVSASPYGNGSWGQEQVSLQNLDENNSVAGANFLNSGISFSSFVNSDASNTGIYLFGGMCPFENATQDSWMASANYSNLMVNVEPTASSSRTIDYQIGVSSSRGPPIAEAGFTITGLQRSYSNTSDGTQTQQQDFVLVGGHTSAAFINMSQVAIFSLPQESWTFLPVEQPNTQRTDLTARADITEIEPRSGHTALLTPDGQSIVLFGGWIGDTSTPADPQLAILNVGEGYGGQGSWAWTVPTTSGADLSTGAGIYGHGAIMLPGEVMMIVGGYSISASSGSRWRRASQSVNTQTLFYNVTSRSWLSEYSPPPTASTAPQTADSGPLSTTSQKAGLGAGLAIGCAAILGLLIFYLWYSRRLKKQREFREKELRNLALGAHRYHVEGLTANGIDARDADIDAGEYVDDPLGPGHGPYPYPTGRNSLPQGWRRAKGHDAERTGLLVEIPSPTRGLRRSLHGRGSHNLPRHDGRMRGAGNIHPIDELEEDEQAERAKDRPSSTALEMTERSRPTTHRISAFSNAPALDPFTDSSVPNGKDSQDLLTQSAPASPVHERATQPQTLGNDWDRAAGALIPRNSSPGNFGGRISPSKSDRTGSNLSERSTRSNLSARSSSGSIARTLSIRSSLLLNSIANPFMAPEGSPTAERSPDRRSGGWPNTNEQRTRSLTGNRPNTANADADSFTTAHSSFAQLQAEGEALLGGRPDRPDTSSSSASNTYHDTATADAAAITAVTSTREPRPTRERRKSWLGSVRRALGRANPDTDRSRSMTTSTPHYDWSAAPSPTTRQARDRSSFPASNLPRRAASDASFWRSKRGARDWDVDEESGRDRWRRNSGDDWGAPEDQAVLAKAEGEAEEDWDVEAAVERRVVQVMFTVPKQRLRVVNADVDGKSLLSTDEGDSKKGEEVQN